MDSITNSTEMPRKPGTDRTAAAGSPPAVFDGQAVAKPILDARGYDVPGHVLVDFVEDAYQDYVPNFRCSGGYVEVPAKYSQMFPTERDDADGMAGEARKRLADLIKAHKVSRVYDETGSHHWAHTLGTLIPLDVWDRVMRVRPHNMLPQGWYIATSDAELWFRQWGIVSQYAHLQTRMHIMGVRGAKENTCQCRICDDRRERAPRRTLPTGRRRPTDGQDDAVAYS